MTHRWISKLACHTTAPSLYGEATPAIQAQIGTAGALFRTATRRHGDCGGTLCVPTPCFTAGCHAPPAAQSSDLASGRVRDQGGERLSFRSQHIAEPFDELRVREVF